MLRWTLGYVYLFELWLSLDICPGVGLQDHMVVLFLVFKGTPILFSIVATPIYIPTNRVWAFLSSHHFQHLLLIFADFFDDSHFDRCEVIWYPNVVLLCISLMISNIEHLFMWWPSHLCIFEKIIIHVFCQFLNDFFVVGLYELFDNFVN